MIVATTATEKCLAIKMNNFLLEDYWLKLLGTKRLDIGISGAKYFNACLADSVTYLQWI